MKELGYANAPALPANVVDFLQALFSSSYQISIGTLVDLKKAGFSEQYTLGYLNGLEAASQMIDHIITFKNVEEQT